MMHTHIARVAEETVLNLKELESRIEVLKNDLAALCVNVGHHEAARIAVTPSVWLDPRAQIAHVNRHTALTGIPTSSIVGPFGFSNPYAPFGGIAPFATGVNPLVGPVGSPYGSPLAGALAGPSFPSFGFR